MFAKVQIMGRAGKDPETVYFQSGTVKTTISIAVSEKYNNKSGESTEKTHWFNCESWGKTAEILANYILKGDLVMFDGVLVQETWNDKTTGQKRDKIAVKVERVHLLPNNRGESKPHENQVTSHATMANPEVQTNQANPDKVPDDIPF